MKKLISVCSLTMLISLFAFGQIEKGNKLVGASLGSGSVLLSEGSGASLQVNPTVGILLNKHWMVGAGVTLGAVVSDGFTGVVGVSPFGRYYFNSKSSTDSLYKGFFLQANVGVVTIFGNEESSFLQGGAGAGYCRFITPDVGLELTAGLQNTAYLEDIGDFNLSLNFSLGLQIVLHKNTHIFGRKSR